jgi:hypothetical protein
MNESVARALTENLVFFAEYDKVLPSCWLNLQSDVITRAAISRPLSNLSCYWQV